MIPHPLIIKCSYCHGCSALALSLVVTLFVHALNYCLVTENALLRGVTIDRSMSFLILNFPLCSHFIRNHTNFPSDVTANYLVFLYQLLVFIFTCSCLTLLICMCTYFWLSKSLYYSLCGYILNETFKPGPSGFAVMRMYFVGTAFVHDVVYKSLVEPHVFISFSAAPKAVKIA